MVLPGFWVTADGPFVVTPTVMSPRAASENAGMRVVSSSWSRGPVVTSFEVVAVGCSLDEAEEPVHSEFSRTVEAIGEEGSVCVSGGPSEEAGVVLCPSGKSV